jgi:hypothetical protein
MWPTIERARSLLLFTHAPAWGCVFATFKARLWSAAERAKCSVLSADCRGLQATVWEAPLAVCAIDVAPLAQVGRGSGRPASCLNISDLQPLLLLLLLLLLNALQLSRGLGLQPAPPP